MSMDILSYTKKRVLELEKEKQNIKFYEENIPLLLMPLEDLLGQTELSLSMLPIDFIFSLNGQLSDRTLRVFDILGLDKTRVPKEVDASEYAEFLLNIDASLNRIGLSINMKMNAEQRKHFNELAYQIEADKTQEVVITSFISWEKIVKRIVFAGVESHVVSYLENKDRDILTTTTREVMKMCNNIRLSDYEIKDRIVSILESQGLEIFNLREVDWEEFEHFKRKTRKR